MRLVASHSLTTVIVRSYCCAYSLLLYDSGGRNNTGEAVSRQTAPRAIVMTSITCCNDGEPRKNGGLVGWKTHATGTGPWPGCSLRTDGRYVSDRGGVAAACARRYFGDAGRGVLQPSALRGISMMQGRGCSSLR